MIIFILPERKAARIWGTVVAILYRDEEWVDVYLHFSTCFVAWKGEIYFNSPPPILFEDETEQQFSHYTLILHKIIREIYVVSLNV
jgi:hypothetical protein